ncbi:MAG: carboxymuconolactone decarboxylase family protein [Proteobacteria bacterium]|nr:carboxymuconolactone decarboxylase family protein [Pseudomonadota bacterium]
MRISPSYLKAHVPWYLKPLLWLQKHKYGQVLVPSQAWATMPRLFFAVSTFYGALERKNSPLSPQLRSLILVSVSKTNGCYFCIDINSSLLIKRAGSEEKVKALGDWRESPVFTESEKAALDYAEKATLTNQKPDEACFNQLKQHFSEEAIMELTALIAFQNMSTKFNSALDIDSQGFCKLKS